MRIFSSERGIPQLYAELGWMLGFFQWVNNTLWTPHLCPAFGILKFGAGDRVASLIKIVTKENSLHAKKCKTFIFIGATKVKVYI